MVLQIPKIFRRNSRAKIKGNRVPLKSSSSREGKRGGKPSFHLSRVLSTLNLVPLTPLLFPAHERTQKEELLLKNGRGDIPPMEKRSQFKTFFSPGMTQKSLLFLGSLACNECKVRTEESFVVLLVSAAPVLNQIGQVPILPSLSLQSPKEEVIWRIPGQSMLIRKSSEISCVFF